MTAEDQRNTPHEVVAVQRPESGGAAIAGIIKRTYQFSETGAVALAEEQLPVIVEPEWAPDPNGEMGELLKDTDCLAPKPATDVIVVGHVHTPEKVREVMAGIAVDRHTRLLRVRGERRAKVAGDGTVTFGSTAAFQRVPLTYTLAYGGYDEDAHRIIDPETIEFDEAMEKALGEPQDDESEAPLRLQGLFGYPRNPVGRAYFIDVDRERADGALLPQLEDPEDPLSPEAFFVASPLAWVDAPIPASLGWQLHSWFPRMVRFTGSLLQHDPPQRPLREAQLGEGDDLLNAPPPDNQKADPRCLLGSAPGMPRVKLRGNEPIVLHSLHPTKEEIGFDLPGERPEISVRVAKLKTVKPAVSLQTVCVEPDHGRFTLTWCAIVPVLGELTDDLLDEAEMAFSFRKL